MRDTGFFMCFWRARANSALAPCDAKNFTGAQGRCKTSSERKFSAAAALGDRHTQTPCQSLLSSDWDKNF